VKPMRKMRVGTGTGGGRVGERSSPGRSLPSGVGRLRAGQRYQRALPKARFYPTLGFIVSNAGEAAGRLASLLNKIKFLSLCLSKWGEAQDNLRCASPPFYFRFFPLLRERTAKARCALRSPSRTARQLLRGWREGEAAQKREKGVSDGHSFSNRCSRPSLTPLSRRGVTKFCQLRTSEQAYHNPPSHPN